MPQNMNSTQMPTQLTLTLPRDVRATWHATAMRLGLRPGQLATAVLMALAASPAAVAALAEAAEEVRGQ